MCRWLEPFLRLEPFLPPLYATVASTAESDGSHSNVCGKRPVACKRRVHLSHVAMRHVRSSALYGRALHTFTVPSLLPVTIRDPSGLKDAEETRIAVPFEREDFGSAFASHTFAVPSSLPVTIHEPSGLNDAELT